MSSTPSNAAAPPPPPPPATTVKPAPVIDAPHVAPARPQGSFLVQLLIYNGAPFKDHWAYWICDPTNPDVGVMMEAAGDVMNGFRFEINRSFDLADTTNRPWKRVDLQWVDGKFFDEKAMMNGGQHVVNHGPVCPFETSAYKVKAPGKTLNAVDDKVIAEKTVGRRISQRNCQTWIVESADQLVRDGIFKQEVAEYLHAIRQ